MELEGKYQTRDIVEGDSADVKALSTQVVESIIMDLLTKIPFKDEISGHMKEKPNEGMHIAYISNQL